MQRSTMAKSIDETMRHIQARLNIMDKDYLGGPAWFDLPDFDVDAVVQRLKAIPGLKVIRFGLCLEDIVSVCNSFFYDHPEYFITDPLGKFLEFKNIPAKLNASYYSIDRAEMSGDGPHADIVREAGIYYNSTGAWVRRYFSTLEQLVNLLCDDFIVSDSKKEEVKSRLAAAINGTEDVRQKAAAERQRTYEQKRKRTQDEFTATATGLFQSWKLALKAIAKDAQYESIDYETKRSLLRSAFENEVLSSL